MSGIKVSDVLVMSPEKLQVLRDKYVEIDLVASESDEFRAGFKKVILTIESSINYAQMESARNMAQIFKRRFKLVQPEDKNDTRNDKNVEKFRMLVGYFDYMIEKQRAEFAYGIDNVEEYDFVEDFVHENGNYLNSCTCCGQAFRGHKRRVTCKKCETEVELVAA